MNPESEKREPPIVSPGVLSRIRANPGGFVLQAQGADAETAAAALARARADLWSVDAGPGSAYGLGDDSFGLAYVSEVVPCPSGPFLYIDAGGLPDRVLREIPQVFVRRLEEAGLTDAVVISPIRGGPLDDLADVRRGVSLHLLPPPVYVRRQRAVMPEGWLGEATAWLEATHESSVWIDLRGVQVEIAIKDAGELLRACRRSEQGCLVVVGDPDRAVVGASTHHGIQPSLVLGAGGGGGGSDADLLKAIERLKDVGRRLAPELGYGFIAVEPRLFALVSGHPPPEWSSGLAGADVVWWACDRLVLDAFCWQVLGPEHLARMETIPDGVLPLDGGRVELAIGEPAEWLPGRPERAGLVARGRRETLTGCLVDGDEALRLVQSMTKER